MFFNNFNALIFKKKYHFNTFLIKMYFCRELSIVIQKTHYAMHLLRYKQSLDMCLVL